MGHLLRGIAEDVHNFLISKDVATPSSDLRRHCRTFEALKTRQISPKFGRLDNVTTVATVASVDVAASDDLAAKVCRVVRDELARFQDAETNRVCHQCALDERYLEEPVAWSRPEYRRHQTYDDYRQNSMTQPGLTSFTRRQDIAAQRGFPGYNAPRKAMTNTIENHHIRPVCFNCCIQGHISKFCWWRSQLNPRACVLPSHAATTIPVF